MTKFIPFFVAVLLLFAANIIEFTDGQGPKVLQFFDYVFTRSHKSKMIFTINTVYIIFDN